MTGTITEQGTGTPVAGAFVELKNTATGDSLTALTSETGEYFIDNAPAGGPYTLTVQAGAYKQSVTNGLILRLGQRLRVDPLMSLSTEEIVIIDKLDPLKDKGRTGPSTTVSQDAMAKMPLQGRNFTDLLAVSPLASQNSFAGQNNRYNNIQIDGGANNDLFGLTANGTPGGQAGAKPISIEALKEFVIQVAPYDVRQSSFTGGLVNAVTKSGTNDYHGDVFGYFQNKSLAGRRDDPTFLDYRTWQFGGDVGGPIIADKLHFFGSVDLQSKNQSFGNSFQLTGDNTHDLATDGFTLDTVKKFSDILKNKYGITNAGDGTSPKLDIPDRNLFLKLTSNMIPLSRLEVSYNFVDASSDVLARFPLTPVLPTATSSGNLRDGYELSNSGYSQANTTNTGRFKLTTNWSDFSNEALGSVSIVRDNRDLPNKLPLILVDVANEGQGMGQRVGTADPWLAAGGERFSHANLLDQNIYEIQDNVTYSGIADHHITLGTSNEFLQIKNIFFQSALGLWAFNSLADFEAGNAAAYQRSFAVPGSGQDGGTAKFSVAQLGLYLQDEWAVLKNLTITPGFRVDLPLLGKANTNPALVNNAAFPIDTSKVPSGNALLSPRVGVNWDVFGDASSVVRGGVGMFTGRPPYVWVSNAYVGNGLASASINCVAANGVPAFTVDPNNQPTTCGTGGPTSARNQEIDYFDPKTKYPQSFRTSAGADQRLPWGLTATVDLMYSKDVNGWYTTDENLDHIADSAEGRAIYGTNFGTTNTSSGPIIRSTPVRFDSVNLGKAIKVLNKNGARQYNGTIALSKVFEEPALQIDAAYTYSNSADRISLTSSTAISNFQFAPVDGTLDQRNVRPSAFDRRHKVTITGTAALPYGFGAGLMYNLVSGLPYTWTVTGDVNGDSISGNDVVYVPASASQITLADPSQYAALEKFIDSQDCLKAAKGGLIQRGACRNAWTEFVNVRGTWKSPEVMGQRIEVQLDIFNLLNMLNSSWGLIDQAATFENSNTAFLKAVGFDAANNRPIYQFSPPIKVVAPVYSPTQSRWRIQLGARYSF